MVEDDEAYFYDRAKLGLERARRTGHPHLAVVKRQLVEPYLARTSLLTTDGAVRRLPS